VASAARFSDPSRVAVDAAGSTVFVSEEDGATVRAIAVSTATVTTVAGKAGVTGSADGVGTDARFNRPTGISSTASGDTVFVADYANHIVRRIAVSTSTVTTVAGPVQAYGNVDAVGTAARFRAPSGVALSRTGTSVYIADSGNHTIRKMVLSTGAVTTIAGSPGIAASTDGVGSAARFNSPRAVAVDGAETQLFVVENSHAVRRIDLATSTVSTLAGVAGTSGS